MELTLQSAKTMKGQKYGYLTGILYLAASDSSGVMDLCPYASPECKEFCLGHTAGRLAMPNSQKAQLRRTMLLHNDRPAFLNQIDKDIQLVVRQAKKKKLVPCFRLNGTSDIPWLSHHFAKKYPGLQFYDYTKIPKPWDRTLPNYHITFSHSELNENECLESLKNGISVGVVFSTKRNTPLPKRWKGYKVIDGDTSDLRFLDEHGIIVGLRAKGTARRLEPGGFVTIANG